MLNIKGIDHIVLRTNRLKEMLNFYCEFLGCKVEKEQPALHLTQLRAGNNLIDLIEVDEPFNLNERNLDHFCLRTDSFDLEFLAKYFKDRHVEITQHGMRYGAQGMGYSIYVKDPQGNEVELRQGT